MFDYLFGWDFEGAAMKDMVRYMNIKKRYRSISFLSSFLLVLAEVSLKKSFECFAVSCLIIELYTHIRYFKGFSRLLKRLTQFFTQLLLLVFQLIQFTFFNFYLPTFNFNSYHRIIKNNSVYDPPFLFLHSFIFIYVITHCSFKFGMPRPIH